MPVGSQVSLVKEHNSRNNVSPIRLNFDEGDDGTEVQTIVTEKEIVDANLKKPFKETVKTPLTRRIIEFTGPEFKMPTNVKLYDGTTDPEDHLSQVFIRGKFGGVAHAGMVAHVPTNFGRECNRMVRASHGW
ncbi:hypothetical protein Tco_0143167 [Tanacetum coccineum]